MKNITLAFAVLVLTIACGTKGEGSTNSTEVVPEETLIDKSFLVDSIQCHAFENSSDYTRIETSDVLSKEEMKRVVDTLGNAIKNNIVYFHINRVRSYGAEYATYRISGSHAVFADRIFYTQFDFNIHQGNVKLEILNSTTYVEHGNINVILTQLKDLSTIFYDARSNLPADDLARKKELLQLQTNISNTRKKYYPLMRKAYYQYLKREMGKKDIDVQMYNNSIYFYGGIFFSKQNILDQIGTLNDMMRSLRFERAGFAPYQGGDCTYWDIYEKGDEAD